MAGLHSLAHFATMTPSLLCIKVDDLCVYVNRTYKDNTLFQITQKFRFEFVNQFLILYTFLLDFYMYNVHALYLFYLNVLNICLGQHGYIKIIIIS